MEKWLKYFLSPAILIVLSCNTQVNQAERHRSKVADSIFNSDKELYQGSKESQQLLKKVISIDPTHDEALREISVPFLKNIRLKFLSQRN